MRSYARSGDFVRALLQRRALPCLGCLLAGLLAVLLLYSWTPNAAHAAAIASAELPRTKLPTIPILSIAGEQQQLASLQGKEATVVVFISTQCPLSNAYIPTYTKLAADFKDRGVSLILVNPNEGQDLTAIASHQQEYGIDSAVFKDVDGKLATSLGVTHCPEACLFNDKGELVYRGRIDDRYVRRGGVPRPVHEENLKDALVASLGHKPVNVAMTEAVGCPIFTRTADSSANGSHKVSYFPTVATILQKRCEECHRPDGIGPFALTSYSDAISWASDIEAYTADGSMPPWKPVAGFGEFQHVRRMPTDEIEQIAAWVKAGCPEGDAAKAPAPIEYPVTWSLGEPDLVLTPAESYELAADGDDVYRNFVFETSFDKDMYLSSYEILPGNRRVVHHVLMYLDGNGISKKLDDLQPGPGYNSALGLPGFIPTGGLGGWAPGNLPSVLGPGVGRILPKGHRIVMQVHYHKTGKIEHDQTKLGLHFSETPPKRAVGFFMVLPVDARFGGMKITPGAANYEVRADFYLNQDLEAITITPHMHLLGKDMTVTATYPDGSEKPLVKVDKWDFNWQETYSFAKPVQLPAGTTLRLVAHFDNSENNPYNPNRPPKLVTWGEQTTEEMCIAFLEVLPIREAASLAELVPPDPFALLKGDFNNRLKGLNLNALRTKQGRAN